MAKTSKRYFQVHQYESSADYERMVTEHNTYGDMAMLAEFTRIQDNKINELKQELEAVK